MWGGLGSNFSNIVASVQKLSAELESQMDEAVGIAAINSDPSKSPALATGAPLLPVVAAEDSQSKLEHNAVAPAISMPAIEAVKGDTIGPATASPDTSLSPVSGLAAASADILASPETKVVDKAKKKKAGKKKGVGEAILASNMSLSTPATPASATVQNATNELKESPQYEPNNQASTTTLAVEISEKPYAVKIDNASTHPKTEAAVEVVDNCLLKFPEIDEVSLSPGNKVMNPTPGLEQKSTTEVPSNAIKYDTAMPCIESVISILEGVPRVVVKGLENKIADLEQDNARLKESSVNSTSYTAELEAKLQQFVKDLASRDKTIESLQKQVSRAELECNKLSESLQVREGSLESAMTQLAEANEQLASKSSKLEALLEEHAVMSSTIKTYAASSGIESELRRQISNLIEENREKDARLQSYDQEGQLLAKKQGDMEKMIRKCKNELREKDAEITKMKDGREQLVKTIEEMQEIIRRHDSDSTNTSKSISAMQAVSQASMERLAKLEAELATKSEEILNQKRVLDAAWSEATELKRATAELRAERDNMKKHTGAKEEKIAEREAAMRDLEQREAVLRATNKQLQDSLQRQMADFSVREDRLREEILDARKRWQDAISNRESLAAEVGQSTAPLLKQISGLQESLKQKSEAWQGIESSLLERALRAESFAESSTYKMKLVEDKYINTSKANEELTAHLHEKDGKLQELLISSERWVRQEREFIERVADLESRLAAESTQRLNAQSAMREMESKVKTERRESKEAVESANKQNQLKISMLSTELEYLKEQLDALKPMGSVDQISSKNITKVKSEQALSETKGSIGNGAARNSPAAGINNSYLPNGEISFVSANRINQQLEIKEQENHSLTLQLQQLQLSRSALLQEVSFLSARNAELEENLGSDSNSAAAFARLEKENIVLLTLLGEKEEELENLISDLQDVKNLYKAQLADLYDKIAPVTDDNTIILAD